MKVYILYWNSIKVSIQWNFTFHADICEKPTLVEHANETFSIAPDTDGRYPVSTILSITCDDTYYPFGPTNLSCEAGGAWSDESPVCEGNKDHTNVKIFNLKNLLWYWEKLGQNEWMLKEKPTYLHTWQLKDQNINLYESIKVEYGKFPKYWLRYLF